MLTAAKNHQTYAWGRQTLILGAVAQAMICIRNGWLSKN